MVPLALLRRFDWPGPELLQFGGDIVLGALLRQQGLELEQFRAGAAINADAGLRESETARRRRSARGHLAMSERIHIDGPEARRIHVGVGGWTFEPWRDNFYPKRLPHARELHYASRQLTAIEVNGTFYSTFKPASYAKWHDETPDGFVFSLKAHRFATHRKLLATAEEPVQRFVNSGIVELRDKLGPIVWQLMPSTRFDAADVEAFFRLLPQEAGGRPLRHVLDARHASFVCDEYLDLAHRYAVATVHADSDKYPAIADPQTPLAYLRLMRTEQDPQTGYPRSELEKWAAGCRAWVERASAREVFVFFISGAKERNPAAAMELIELLP